ncbi:MAG: hypothetical protein QOC68_4 [Solirubrobacteraceae bacterium]|jgi:hypothetical protein|nr:hypothetical protein [Solirubrobacteraceae bacterium]
MQRVLVLAAVAALALAVAPAAVAKEITKAEVCGADGCVSVDDADGRFALMEGGPPRTPPAAAPYYEVNMEMDHRGGGFSYTAVPDRRAYRADDGGWYEMPPAMVVLVAKAAARSRAFPAAGLIGAAPAPEPPADTGNALWPEGALIALVLAAGGVFLVRLARGSRRFGPASS